MRRRILVPLPDRDFDPTEVTVPWRLLEDAGHEVVFATERGATPACDPRSLNGILLGRFGASREVRRLYTQLEQAPAFRSPLAWDGADPDAFDGLLLPGGHAPGMRQYLGSPLVQERAAAFMRLERPVGAICHGVVVLARAGALAGRRTTGFPAYLERIARLGLVWLGDYMRTSQAYVEHELRRAGALFERGPLVPLGGQFVVVDRSYVSGRWLHDAELFARSFLQLLDS